MAKVEIITLGTINNMRGQQSKRGQQSQLATRGWSKQFPTKWASVYRILLTVQTYR